MKIECSVEELKQLIKEIKNTPVAGTTDDLSKKQLKQVDRYLSENY